jgi:UDP-N-acetylmuramoylalanine--D-glutamate ligase
MKIAILGFGSQGASALAYYQAQGGHELTVCDANESLDISPAIVTQLGNGYLADLIGYDLLIRSPSIHPRDIVSANGGNKSILEKVTTNTNIFMEVCPSRNIIGVTGTKGKGTTSTLIATMLEAAGFRAHLGGNIGTPPLDMLANAIQPDDWVVLELANFQLIDMKYSPLIAVCLMVVPEHLDWHADIEEYVQAKQQLFRLQKPEDTSVYYVKSGLSKEVVSVSPANKIPYFAKPGAVIENDKVVIGETEICDTQDIKLLGKHNHQNICAAVTAVWRITQDAAAIKHVIQTVEGLPLRLQFIREVDGVQYYNDSYGSTPETAIVALEAFSEPKVIILGGSDKGASYEELARAVVDNNVRAVIAIGLTGPAIAASLRKAGFENIGEGAGSMPEIIDQAHRFAQAGDIVLLSTACASFDMFQNYKDRGEQFNQAVEALASTDL